MRIYSHALVVCESSVELIGRGLLLKQPFPLLDSSRVAFKHGVQWSFRGVNIFDCLQASYKTVWVKFNG